MSEPRDVTDADEVRNHTPRGNVGGRSRTATVAFAAAGLVAVAAAAAVMAGPVPDAGRDVRVGDLPSAFARPAGLMAPSTLADAGAEAGLVDISSRAPGVIVAGTGIVLSSAGEVVTNNHVVAGAKSIVATDRATGRGYPAVVLGTDPRHDIAVIALRGASGLPVAPIADSAAVKVGTAIRAIGNAGGKGGTPAVTAGTVTGLNQCVTAHDAFRGVAERLCGLIQATVTVRPGDSGGPMVGAAGVIGMDVAADTVNGFAIPIDTVIAVARRLASSSGGLAHRGLQVTDTPAPQGRSRGVLPSGHAGL